MMEVQQARAAAIAALDSLCTTAGQWNTVGALVSAMYAEPTREQREEAAREAEERRKAQAEREARKQAARQETVERFNANRARVERTAVNIPTRWDVSPDDLKPAVDYAIFPTHGFDEAWDAIYFSYKMGFNKGFRCHKAQADRAAKAAARRA